MLGYDRRSVSVVCWALTDVLLVAMIDVWECLVCLCVTGMKVCLVCCIAWSNRICCSYIGQTPS